MEKKKTRIIQCKTCGIDVETSSSRRQYCEEHSATNLKERIRANQRKYNLKKRIEKKKDLFCIYCGKSLIEEPRCMIVCSAEECRAKYKSDAPKEWYKDKENRKKSIKCSTEWNKKNVKRHRFFANRYAKEHKEERKEYTKKYEENKMKEYKAIGEINKDREVGNLIRSLK